jgi:hypothetical protein
MPQCRTRRINSLSISAAVPRSTPPKRTRPNPTSLWLRCSDGAVCRGTGAAARVRQERSAPTGAVPRVQVSGRLTLRVRHPLRHRWPGVAGSIPPWGWTGWRRPARGAAAASAWVSGMRNGAPRGVGGLAAACIAPASKPGSTEGDSSGGGRGWWGERERQIKWGGGEGGGEGRGQRGKVGKGIRKEGQRNNFENHLSTSSASLRASSLWHVDHR